MERNLLTGNGNVNNYTPIMPQARHSVVSREEVGVYHCVSRCVRRAFLCGWDDYSGRDFEHRREWVRDRLEELSGLFAVEVFSYAVMSNHLHVVLRIRPDWADGWSDQDVAERWCRLFRGKAAIEEGRAYDEKKLAQLLKDPEKLALCRKRLSDLSWFMRCTNEWVARRANREDECTGRFWEGRFKCQRLMDEAAVLACMAYVDLNPVRARMADGLEDSEFTSVYDRIASRKARERLSKVASVENPTRKQRGEIEREERRAERSRWLLDLEGPESPFGEMTEEYYLRLVEWTGRTIRADKPGYIPVELKDPLVEFGLDAESWAKNVEAYGGLFHRIAGSLADLRDYALAKGQRWFCGRTGSSRFYGRPPAKTA